MNVRADGLPIGALSKQTGCKIETIRYYEKAGLLPVPARTLSGYRQYASTHLKRLTFIRRARALGFSIEEVRKLLKLADERKRPCVEIDVNGVDLPVPNVMPLGDRRGAHRRQHVIEGCHVITVDQHLTLLDALHNRRQVRDSLERFHLERSAALRGRRFSALYRLQDSKLKVSRGRHPRSLALDIDYWSSAPLMASQRIG